MRRIRPDGRPRAPRVASTSASRRAANDIPLRHGRPAVIPCLRATGPRAGLGDKLRWYLFFALKTALLLIAALLASFELSHLVVTISSSANPYSLAGMAAIWFFLLGAHLTLTWSIRDQLGRCRVCLRGLGLRVNLASPGRILIDLTGDELVCDEGHGMLHIPVMESGSVDSERWTYLDESWQVLLGHRKLEHTLIYLHLSQRHLTAVPNPLDTLTVSSPDTVTRSRRKVPPR